MSPFGRRKRRRRRNVTSASAPATKERSLRFLATANWRRSPRFWKRKATLSVGPRRKFCPKAPPILPQNGPDQMKNGSNGTTANAWADGDDRASFGKKAASKNASATWNYPSCLDLIEEELSNIINAPESDYDEEDPFFDENEPMPFERGYEKILAIIKAAKEGEERLREYVRRQAEFLGITGKHARGESNPQPAD